MAQTKIVSRPSKLSDEHVVDSSDEENIENGAENNTSKATSKSKSTSKLKRTKESASSGKTTKAHLASTKSLSAAKPKLTSKDDRSAEVHINSEEDSESRSSEESEGESEASQNDSNTTSSTNSSSRKRKSTPDSNPQKTQKKPKTKSSAAVRINPKPFKAPHGYEPVVLTSSDYASQAASLFEDLSQKQIWHISAPDSVSVESILELDIQAALQRKPILTKDGIDYNMSPATSDDSVLLLPAGQNSTYEPTAIKISKRFDLREMSRVPKATRKGNHDDTTTGIIFTATTEGTKRKPREQPEGLKQRYTPFGASAAPRDKAVEMTTAVFRIPGEVLGEPFADEAAREDDGDAMQIDEKTTEKKKGKDKSSGSPEKKKKKKRRIVDEGVL